MIGNPFLPVALFPDWLLPQRQQREPLSGQKRTPASGPEGRGSAVAVSLPQTLNPGSKTKVAHWNLAHQTEDITSASLRSNFIIISPELYSSKPLFFFFLIVALRTPRIIQRLTKWAKVNGTISTFTCCSQNSWEHFILMKTVFSYPAQKLNLSKDFPKFNEVMKHLSDVGLCFSAWQSVFRDIIRVKSLQWTGILSGQWGVLYLCCLSCFTPQKQQISSWLMGHLSSWRAC